MRRMRTAGLTIALLAGAAASCNLTLGFDPYFDAGSRTSSSSGSSSGHGGADGGTGGSGATGGTGGVPTPPGGVLWAHALGTSGDDTVNAMAVGGPLHHVFLTGKTGAPGTLDCQNLAPDAGGPATGSGYVIELDDKGACVWGMLFGDGCEGTGVAVDGTGNLALTGTVVSGNLSLLTFTGSLVAGSFVARIQADRTALWAHTLYSPIPHVVVTTGVAMSADKLYFGGYADGPVNVDTTTGTTPFSMGDDGFVFSCDTAGGYLQAVHLSGDGTTDQQVLGVAVNTDGSQFSIAGVSSGNTGFNAVQTETSPAGSGASANAVFASCDSGNNVLRSAMFGDGAAQSGSRVAYATGGALFLAGTYDGTLALTTPPLVAAAGTSVFLTRFDTGNTPAASIGLTAGMSGAANGEDVHGLAVDAAGDVVLVGTLRGTATLGGVHVKSAGADDVYVAKLASAPTALTPAWLSTFGGAGSESADAVAIAGDGGILVAGHFTGDLAFGGGTDALHGNGMKDVFLVKLQP